MDSERLVASSEVQPRNTDKLDGILRNRISEAQTRSESGEEQPRKPTTASKPKKSPDAETDATVKTKGQDAPEVKEEDVKPNQKATPTPNGADKPKESAPKAKSDSEEEQPFAPKNWSQEARTAFEQVPPEVQTEINKLVKNLQGGFTQKAQSLSDARRVANDIAAALTPEDRNELRSRNMTEGQAFKELLGYHKAYRTNPAGYVQMLIKAANLTPEHLGFTASPQNGTNPPATPDGQPHGQTQADPMVLQVQQELKAIKGVLTQSHQSAVQGRQNALARNIESFANEIDADGQMLRPHFDKVLPQIFNLIAKDPEISQIEDPIAAVRAAYEAAIWARPDIRTDLLTAEKERQQAEFEAQRSRTAVGPRPRSGSVGNGGSKPLPTDPKAKLDAMLRRNFTKAGGK